MSHLAKLVANLEAARNRRAEIAENIRRLESEIAVKLNLGPAVIAPRPARPSHGNANTEREAAIKRLKAEGKTSREIATELNLSPGVVHYYYYTKDKSPGAAAQTPRTRGPDKRKRAPNLTEETRAEIVRRLAEPGATHGAVAKAMNLSKASIARTVKVQHAATKAKPVTKEKTTPPAPAPVVEKKVSGAKPPGSGKVTDEIRAAILAPLDPTKHTSHRDRQRALGIGKTAYWRVRQAGKA